MIKHVYPFMAWIVIDPHTFIYIRPKNPLDLLFFSRGCFGYLTQ